MAISEYDYVKVGSGTEETYVPFDDSDGGYNVSAALDNINGEIVAGGLENKTDYLEETKEQIKQAIIFKGGEVGDVFRDYASAIWEIVPTDSLSVKYMIDTNGVLRKLQNNVMSFAGVVNIYQEALRYAYYNTAINQDISFPDLEQITGQNSCVYAFNSNAVKSVSMPKLHRIWGDNACESMFGAQYSALKTIDLSALEEIGVGDWETPNCCRYMFSSNSALSAANLPSLRIINGSGACYGMFEQTGVENIDLSNLRVISGNQACYAMFRNSSKCKGSFLNDSFKKLVEINGTSCCYNMFSDCNAEQFSFTPFSLKKIYGSNALGMAFRSTGIKSLVFAAVNNNSFGEERSAFGYMLRSCTGVGLHFPKNTQALIESMNGYSTTTPFGATSGTVSFDLPATFILVGENGTRYERNPYHDGGENECWRVEDTDVDSTGFYTAGDGFDNDPAVGQAIYSDAECTNQVDTIVSIED